MWLRVYIISLVPTSDGSCVPGVWCSWWWPANLGPILKRLIGLHAWAWCLVIPGLHGPAQISCIQPIKPINNSSACCSLLHCLQGVSGQKGKSGGRRPRQGLHQRKRDKSSRATLRKRGPQRAVLASRLDDKTSTHPNHQLETTAPSPSSTAPPRNIEDPDLRD